MKQNYSIVKGCKFIIIIIIDVVDLTVFIIISATHFLLYPLENFKHGKSLYE